MIHLDDKRLWGNEAADDEDPTILNSYFVPQPTFNQFFDPSTRLSIARARKGMGKSALLRECAYRIQGNDKTIVISIKGADLAAQKALDLKSADEYLYDWQQRICSLINRHLGAEIGFALNDDEMTLVETAELSGFKRRNLIGALVDRLKGKLGPIELQKLEVTDNRAILKRVVTEGDWVIWLLIDDIDATFINTPEHSLRLSTFFSACRDLAASFKGVVVRTCVRTDVWTTIRKRDEALDKVEQYIFDIEWSLRDTGLILAERINSYLRRKDIRDSSGEADNKTPVSDFDGNQWKKTLQTLRLVFPLLYPWGRGGAYSYRVIHVLSASRPRWAAQLCRMAGVEATRAKATFIKFGHIKQVLERYGRYRLDDITREHRHQCENLNLIVNAFARHKVEFNTQELLGFIRKEILLKMNVFIDGLKISDDLSIARFLFRIGFIDAKRRKYKGPRYYRFEEKPELLTSVSNLDEKMTWYIHPAFHAALNLKFQ